MLGANPYASNGSLCTAPDFPGRIEAMRARGGKLVVVDPRRSRTADAADEWLPDPPRHRRVCCSWRMVARAVRRRPRRPRAASSLPHLAGLDEVRMLAAPFTPEAVAPACGIDAATIRRIAHELAAAPTAAVYGRIGTSTQAEFGTVGVVAGRRAQHAAPATSTGPAARCSPCPAAGGRHDPGHARRRQGVHGRPGPHPGARPARGDGRVPGGGAGRGDRRTGRRRGAASRAPWSRWPATRCCRRPNADRLDAALDQLDFMVSASTSTSTRPPATPT